MLIARDKIKTLRNVLNDKNNFEMPISSQFRFMVISNMNILESELTKMIAFDESQILPDRYSEYDKKRKETLTEFGVSQVSDVEKLEPEVNTAFQEKILSLNKEYHEVIVALKSNRAARDAFYAQEVELPLKVINVHHMPTISKAVGEKDWFIWNTLMPLVVD